MRGALESGRYELIDGTVEDPTLSGQFSHQIGKVTCEAGLVAQRSVSTALKCCRPLVFRVNAYGKPFRYLCNFIEPHPVTNPNNNLVATH